MQNTKANSSTSRRDVLQRGVRNASIIAGTTVVTALLGGLGGCTGSRPRSTNQIGQPIPADPVFTAKPVKYRPSGATSSTPTSSSLTTLPSFVIARSKWTKGTTNAKLTEPMRKITRITVHHDAISPIPSGRYGDSVRRLVAIRRGHLGNRWADIGYHYAIDPAGRIWQARPLIYQGAHVKNHNPGNLGIVVFGNYEQSRPTSKALESLQRLLTYEMRRFEIPLNRLYTHRELRPTACPGRHLQTQMNTLRRSGGHLALISTSTSHA